MSTLCSFVLFFPFVRHGNPSGTTIHPPTPSSTRVKLPGLGETPGRLQHVIPRYSSSIAQVPIGGKPLGTGGCLGGGFKYVLFSLLCGEDSHFDEYFSNGLKPPTSYVFFLFTLFNVMFYGFYHSKSLWNHHFGICLERFFRHFKQFHHQDDPPKLALGYLNFTHVTKRGRNSLQTVKAPSIIRSAAQQQVQYHFGDILGLVERLVVFSGKFVVANTRCFFVESRRKTKTQNMAIFFLNFAARTKIAINT